jgi:hypothetical protein
MFWISGPYNLSLVQAVIRKITNFEFELDDVLKEDVWQFTDKEDLVIYYEAAGYDSNILMFTMGLELYFFWIILLVLLIAIAIKKCTCKERIKKFQESYLYNALCVYFLESSS